MGRPLGLPDWQGSTLHHLEAVGFATLEWVEWFNNRRLLTSIGDVPPAEYRQQYYRAQEAPAMLAGVN